MGSLKFRQKVGRVGTYLSSIGTCKLSSCLNFKMALIMRIPTYTYTSYKLLIFILHNYNKLDQHTSDFLIFLHFWNIIRLKFQNN